MDSPNFKAKGQHIFPDDELHEIAVRWKELNAQRRDAEAMVLLEQIVVGSTPMFERLAQHEKYHRQVELPVLIGAAQERVVKWLLRWDPKKGKLFTWFSKCAKHAFLSEVSNVCRFRKHYHTTGENLDKFIGAEDHAIDKHDLEAEMQLRLKELTCRWGHPQEIGCLQLLIACLMDDDRRHNRQGAIRAAAYAYGLPMDFVKFFHRWALSALRGLFLDRIRVPLTDADLIYLSESYSLFVDLIDMIGLDLARKLIAKHGGSRIKIPTLASVLRLRQNLAIYEDFRKTPLDPDSLAEVAERHHRTARSAADAYAEMCEILDPRRAGEYYIYGDNDPDD